MADKFVDTKILGTFDGTTESWSEFDGNIDSFNDTLPDEYEKILRMQDPATRDRVTRRYTAPEEDDEGYEGPDPTGALPGEVVNQETAAQKAAAARDYVRKLRKLFAWYRSAAPEGKAKEIATEMAKAGNRDGKQLHARWKAHYEDVTNAHAGHLFKELINKAKDPSKPVQEHTDSWNKECASVEAHLKWDQMKIILYLMSLGPQFRTFFDIVTTSTEKLDIHEVQKRAADYGRGHDDSDEGKSHQLALSAQQQRTNNRGTGRAPSNDNGMHLSVLDKARRPCVACGDEWHCWNRCFDGGLAYMTDQEKYEYLERQREKRRRLRARDNRQDNKQDKRQKTGNAGTDSQTAMVAMQIKHKAALDTIKETLESKMLHGITNELSSVLSGS